MKKLLRLFVMCTIRHPEEYYQTGMKSVGLDPATITQDEIAAWKAVCKKIEADHMIFTAFTSDKVSYKEIDKIVIELNEKIAKVQTA